MFICFLSQDGKVVGCKIGLFLFVFMEVPTYCYSDKFFARIVEIESLENAEEEARAG